MRQRITQRLDVAQRSLGNRVTRSALFGGAGDLRLQHADFLLELLEHQARFHRIKEHADIKRQVEVDDRREPPEVDVARITDHEYRANVRLVEHEKRRLNLHARRRNEVLDRDYAATINALLLEELALSRYLGLLLLHANGAGIVRLLGCCPQLFRLEGHRRYAQNAALEFSVTRKSEIPVIFCVS